MRKVAGRIVLGRHGETEWNREGRIMGQRDSCLTQSAHRTLRAMSGILDDLAIDWIFSSCLGRSAFTSASYAMRLRVPLSFRESLKELSGGIWEGCLRSAVGRTTASLRMTWDQKPPRGESYADAEHRVRLFLQEIAAMEDQTILIIGHAGINRVILKEMLGLEKDFAMRSVFPHDCFYVVEYQDVICIRSDMTVRKGLLLSPD